MRNVGFHRSDCTEINSAVSNVPTQSNVPELVEISTECFAISDTPPNGKLSY
jgi:hypothetical protein